MFPNRRPRLVYLAEIALGHLEDFRRHWKDGSLAKKKNRSRNQVLLLLPATDQGESSGRPEPGYE